MRFFKKAGNGNENKETIGDEFRRAVFGDEFEEFVRYVRSPWRIVWANFLGGMFRGLGFVIGMTLILAILIWILAELIDPVVSGFFPLFREAFSIFLERLKNFTPDTGLMVQ